jgi:hypothetical protein
VRFLRFVHQFLRKPDPGGCGEFAPRYVVRGDEGKKNRKWPEIFLDF